MRGKMLFLCLFIICVADYVNGAGTVILFYLRTFYKVPVYMNIYNHIFGKTNNV